MGLVAFHAVSEPPPRLRRVLKAVAVDVGLLRRRRAMRTPPPPPDAPAPSWRSIVEGVRFAGARRSSRAA
jgi:hypothetical protein